MASFTTPHIILIFLFIVSNLSPSFGIIRYNVLYYGAKPNGTTDSAQAFRDAWVAACDSMDSAMIYVPKGRYYIGSSVEFKGDNCTNHDIMIRIDGTLMAPVDRKVLYGQENWLGFDNVTGVTIIGGAMDGKGASRWACMNQERDCVEGATSLRFTNSNNIVIKGLLSLNSEMFHIVFNRCNNVRVEGVKIIASGDSPNTDGIHIQRSTNVTIINASIKTGDDCISIGPGTKNLWIERVACGPGHGISIGSLAKDPEEEGVENVTVLTTVFNGTDNGLRIKSWARPSTGFVQGVRFISSLMINVKQPIVIDQDYCPHNQNCPGLMSGINIIDVTYQGIRGTSTKEIAINLNCSATDPCKGIRFKDIKLKYKNKVAQSLCTNVIDTKSGTIQNGACSFEL